jgi:hypothetical protein
MSEFGIDISSLQNLLNQPNQNDSSDEDEKVIIF